VIAGLLDDYIIFKKNDCYGLHELVRNEDYISEKLIYQLICKGEGPWTKQRPRYN
jgi:hypothetical protein